MTATDRMNGSAERSISFGPFQLLSRQRLLLQGEKPIHLGSRAFDVLLALLDRPGELVSKEEIIARVWPNTFVAPVNLAVHISALRRALGDGQRGKRYVMNIPGRGYRFVAPVTIGPDSAPMVAQHPDARLPPQTARGSEPAAISIEAQTQGRLLTIVNPGGLDKASIAVAAVKRLIGVDENDVWLVDLTPLDARRGVI
jgi:DNA-binding winged helix-turn-helix (wHTH) protein